MLDTVIIEEHYCEEAVANIDRWIWSGQKISISGDIFIVQVRPDGSKPKAKHGANVLETFILKAKNEDKKLICKGLR